MDLPINLERPLAIFDLEATSTYPHRARIFQFGGIRIGPDGEEERMSRLYDPMKPIPEEVEELTGISDEDVADRPTLTQEIGEIAQFIKGADVCGHNAKEYDVPLLESAFARSPIDVPGPKDRKILDTLELEKALSGLSLEFLYRSYTGKELEESHRADTDAQAVLEVLRGQTELHSISDHTISDIERDVVPTYLDPKEKFEKKAGDITFRFGKHRYDTLEEVKENNPNYINWMMEDAYESLGQYIEPYL